MIQILTYTGKEEQFKGKYVTINNFHDSQSLDEFEINIIDLNDSRIWQNEGSTYDSCNCLNDLKSIYSMIINTSKTNIIFLFPQNIFFEYSRQRIPTTYQYRYTKKCELKNMIFGMKQILNYLYNGIDQLNIIYENTKTQIGEKNISASFYFVDIDSLSKSIGSDKTTTIKFDKVILSTLNITSYDEVISFLKHIHLISKKEEVPKWLKEEKMFDDQKQLDLIEEKSQIIEDANKDIEKAKKILNKNEKYKSILYTSGDELVDVIFEILQQMLGCDLSHFIDEKKEDFNFELNNKIYLGEIKGITSNVKSGNVTQLEVHVQNYLDDHQSEQDNIIALLIINHQRKRPLSDREEVHDTQINLAERNGSLIVETITLLKMFEKYLNGTLTREKCIEILTNNTGLLSTDNF